MAEEEDKGSIFDGLNEIEKIKKQEDLLNEAVNNSYDIVTKKTTLADLLLKRDDGDYTAIAHDMENGWTYDDLEIFITYFENKEEYEKCAVLKKILDESEE